MVGKVALAFAACLAAGVGAARVGAAADPPPPDPSFDAAVLAMFDTPGRPPSKAVTLPNGTRGVARCFDYPAFRVKELDYGQHGDDAISVTPMRGGERPPCGEQDDPGEIVLKEGPASVFVGAKDIFADVISTLTNDAGPFWIINGLNGKTLYTDQNLVGDQPKIVSANNGVLTMTYTRGVVADCSILSGGQRCWSDTARTRHLVPAVAGQAPPVAACAASYAAPGAGLARVAADDPSVITYDVTVRIEATGRTTVLKRGPLGCLPRS